MGNTLDKRIPVAAIPQPVTPSKLAHVVLKTSNFTAMTRWYLKVLNGRIALGNEFLSFITYDEEHHRIGIANVRRLGTIDPERSGLDHIAFTFGDLGRLLSTFVRLRAEAILPSWTMNHGVTTSFYYKDPDGNKVELQFDNFATTEELQHYFETDPDFAANPLGAPFDPDQMIADYDAGMPLNQLLKVPAYPPGMSPPQILREMGLTGEPA
jgi:catechol 2,3-dioxygenase-like lactoylglutathione lyase family enzyme